MKKSSEEKEVTSSRRKHVQNKLDFKQDFERDLARKYGRSVPDSHVTERYDILGEMVRDYAGYYWRNCREDIVKNGRKQCIYFSMEFLIGRLLVSNMQNLGIYNVAKDGLSRSGHRHQ
jgi:starch phosphorylase